jgi:hypothetical protein
MPPKVGARHSATVEASLGNAKRLENKTGENECLFSPEACDRRERNIDGGAPAPHPARVNTRNNAASRDSVVPIGILMTSTPRAGDNGPDAEVAGIAHMSNSSTVKPTARARSASPKNAARPHSTIAKCAT